MWQAFYIIFLAFILEQIYEVMIIMPLFLYKAGAARPPCPSPTQETKEPWWAVSHELWASPNLLISRARTRRKPQTSNLPWPSTCSASLPTSCLESFTTNLIFFSIFSQGLKTHLKGQLHFTWRQGIGLGSFREVSYPTSPSSAPSCHTHWGMGTPDSVYTPLCFNLWEETAVCVWLGAEGP